MYQKQTFRKKRNIFIWSSLAGWLLYVVISKTCPDTLLFYFTRLILILGSLTLSTIGSFWWMKYKARNPLFSMLGLFAPIGWIILAILTDFYQYPAEEIQDNDTQVVDNPKNETET